MARLVLVGLPGVGKSSVAQMLAQRWGCAWADTDDLIAVQVRRPAPDVLRDAGEPAFRDAELTALRTALSSDAVVATGGGVVLTPAARELLTAATTIWLDCADEVILSRLTDGDRPLLGGDATRALARLRGQRESWYRAVSRTRVEASGTLEDVSERVARALSELDQ